MRRTASFLIALTITLFACKMLEDKPAANCNASAVPENSFCFEYSKRDYSSPKSICAEFHGIWSETGACDRTNALGACKMKGGITKVFYSGTKFKTATEAQAECKVGDWIGPNEK
jgi:hypothetical protein